MAEGLTNELLWTALATAILAGLVALRDMPPLLTAMIVAARFTLPVWYFAFQFDGTWTFLDDVTYFEEGSDLLRRGANPFTILFHGEGVDMLSSTAGGHHILYYWWNLLAEYLFGEHYYAPCFMNVLLTFVTGHLFARTLRLLGAGERYRLLCHSFVLLHWDVVAWSSLVNFKDVMVQTLTVAAFYFLVAFIKRRHVAYLAGMAGCTLLFYWIRFYVPLLMMGSAAVWTLTQWQDLRKYPLFLLLAAMAYRLAPMLTEFSDLINPTSIAFGATRFMLTPQPWNILPGYSFLTIPSALHWVCLVPGLIGGAMLWNQSSMARLFLIYFIATVLMYAVTDELLGPRQRLQLSFIFAWMQFHFFWQVEASRSHAAVPTRPLIHHAPQRLMRA